ncbi:MAG: type II secretion system secretin GspD [Vulcanimicrobiota bacterium]
MKNKTAVKLIISLLIAILLIPSGLFAQNEELKKPVQIEKNTVNTLKGNKIFLNFENAEIQVVAKLISELTNKNIIMDSRIQGKISILSSREVTAGEAWKMFVSALNAYGYDVVDWGKTAKIIPMKNKIKEPSKFYSEDNVAQGVDYLVAVVALKNADPNQISTVLQNLVSEAGAVIPYAPSKSLLIADDSFNVKKLIKIARHLDTIGQKQITRTYFLEFANSSEIEDNLKKLFPNKESGVVVTDYSTHNAVIVMATENQLREIEVLIKEMDQLVDRRDKTRKFRVVQLKNADSVEVAKILTEMLQEGSKVQKKITKTGDSNGSEATPETDTFISNKVSADPETNSIILYVTDSEMEEVAPMVAKLDATRKQILITAIIAEVTMDNSITTGANWQVIGDDGYTASFGGGKDIQSIYQLLSSGNFILGGIDGDTTVVNVNGRKIEFPNIFALIQFLNEDSNFNIISMPKVLTMDHKEATMNVGSIVPFATGVKFDANGQPVITYDYKDVGLTLNVTPHIGQGDLVRLKVKQQIQDVTDFIQQNIGAIGYVVPVVSTRDVETFITLGDSQTVIIGGLISKRTIDSIKKVPILGDIPIIGYAFKNQQKETQKTTLFIFLTPHIVEDTRKLVNLSKQYEQSLEEPADPHQTPLDVPNENLFEDKENPRQ